MEGKENLIATVIALWLTIFGLGALLSWIFTLCYIAAARRWGVVDYPDDRKPHEKPTPTGAGVAIFLAVLPMAFFAGIIQYALGAAVVVIGFVDDCRRLPWQPRLVAYLAIGGAAAFVALPGVSLPWLAAAGLWIALLINAFNFIDNMDGLCTGVTLIVAACLMPLQEAREDSFPYWFSAGGFNAFHLLLLTGALAAFFRFNRRPARAFLGDAGSTFLGFFLGVASVPLLVNRYEDPTPLAENWLAPLCMFAIPIYDLFSVAFLRVWQRRGLFLSDKNNLSHRLVNLGLCPASAVRLIWLLVVVSCVGGLLLYQLPDPMRTIAGIAQLGFWWIGLPVIEYCAYRFFKQ
jgi:UDP-GlcNAc:undecaprenyl-phosphate GlcNAc-1-phosphate transferase